MKLSTTQIFKHSIFCTKGFKFDTTKLNKFHDLFGKIGLSFINNDRVLQIEELHTNNLVNVEPEMIFDCMTDLIIEIDNSNHYRWLDKNLNAFWKNIFGKSLDETSCAGIICNHGDKCYQYKDEWLKHGIPFYYGVAIYLLTYTSELGDTSKHMSSQWVIDNYDKYVNLLNPIQGYTIELKSEMSVKLNIEEVKANTSDLKVAQLLKCIGDRIIHLTTRHQNSNRVVKDKIMIKGVGVYDPKYFTEVTQ